MSWFGDAFGSVTRTIGDIGGHAVDVVDSTSRDLAERTAEYNPFHSAAEDPRIQAVAFAAEVAMQVPTRVNLSTVIKGSDEVGIALPSMEFQVQSLKTAMQESEPQVGQGDGDTFKVSTPGKRGVLVALSQKSINLQWAKIHGRDNAIGIRQVYYEGGPNAVLRGYLLPFEIIIPSGAYAAKQNNVFLVLRFESGTIRLNEHVFNLDGWELAFPCNLNVTSISNGDYSMETLLRDLSTHISVVPDPERSFYGKANDGHRITNQEWLQRPEVKQSESNLMGLLASWMTSQTKQNKTHFGHTFGNPARDLALPLTSRCLFSPVTCDSSLKFEENFILYSSGIETGLGEANNAFGKALARRLSENRNYQEGVYGIFEPTSNTELRLLFRDHCASLHIQDGNFGREGELPHIGTTTDILNQNYFVTHEEGEDLDYVSFRRVTGALEPNRQLTDNMAEQRRAKMTVTHQMSFQPASGRLEISSQLSIALKCFVYLKRRGEPFVDPEHMSSFDASVFEYFWGEFALSPSMTITRGENGRWELAHLEKGDKSPSRMETGNSEYIVDDVYTPETTQFVNSITNRWYEDYTSNATRFVSLLKDLEYLKGQEISDVNWSRDGRLWNTGTEIWADDPAMVDGYEFRNIESTSFFSRAPITGTQPPPEPEPTQPVGKPTEPTQPAEQPPSGPAIPTPPAPGGGELASSQCKLRWKAVPRSSTVIAGDSVTLIIEALNATSSVQYFGSIQIRFKAGDSADARLLEYAPATEDDEEEDHAKITVTSISPLSAAITTRVSSLEKDGETWWVVLAKINSPPLSMPPNTRIVFDVVGVAGTVGSHALWVGESWASVKGAFVDMKEDCLSVKVEQ